MNTNFMLISEFPSGDTHIIYCSAYGDDDACMTHEHALKMK